MSADSPLVAYLVDELGPLGHAQARRMFGGHGLYLDGLIFALVIDETLYLKVDDGNRASFEAAGMKPFTYRNRGKLVALPYWEAPAEVVEEPDRLREWAAAAAAVARRSLAAGGTRPKAKRKPRRASPGASRRVEQRPKRPRSKA